MRNRGSASDRREGRTKIGDLKKGPVLLELGPEHGWKEQKLKVRGFPGTMKLAEKRGGALCVAWRGERMTCRIFSR